MRAQSSRECSPVLVWLTCVLAGAALVLSVCRGWSRDLGQWETTSPAIAKWYRELMQPDNPAVSCCGVADGYYADDYEIDGDNYVAIITDDRDDAPLGRPHVPLGTKVPIPKNKIKFDRGNPTGHGIVFLGGGYVGNVFCYLPPNGV